MISSPWTSTYRSLRSDMSGDYNKKGACLAAFGLASVRIVLSSSSRPLELTLGWRFPLFASIGPAPVPVSLDYGVLTRPSPSRCLPLSGASVAGRPKALVLVSLLPLPLRPLLHAGGRPPRAWGLVSLRSALWQILLQNDFECSATQF
jgi:hypothetical protein